MTLMWRQDITRPLDFIAIKMSENNDEVANTGEYVPTNYEQNEENIELEDEIERDEEESEDDEEEDEIEEGEEYEDVLQEEEEYEYQLPEDGDDTEYISCF